MNILILTIRLDCESVPLEYVTGIKKSEFLFVSQNITTKKIWFNILYYKEFVLVTVKHVFTPLHSTIQRLQKRFSHRTEPLYKDFNNAVFLSGSSDYSPSVLEITAVLASVSSGTGPNLFSVLSPFLMVRMK